MKNIDLRLSQLAQGAIQEKLDYELNKVLDNIHDPNTKATDKRTVTIKIDFTPNENRQTVTVESNFTTKLANVEGGATKVLSGRNMDTGEVEAKELKSNMPGQKVFDSDNQRKTDIGGTIDVVQKELEQKKVIDLQRGSK